jgi:hypothetical protein
MPVGEPVLGFREFEQHRDPPGMVVAPDKKQTPLPQQGRQASNPFCGLLLLVVALFWSSVVVNLLRYLVLLVIDLLLFLLRQMTTVGLSVSSNFVVDVVLFILQMRGLAGIHLVILNPVGNAVLLVFCSLADLAAEIMLRVSVVFILMDLIRQLVLLLLQLRAIGRCQVAVVLRAHLVFFLVNVRHIVFQPRCFAGG